MTETMTDRKASSTRKRAVMLFGVFAAFQLLLPASYYFQSNPYDERYAWRMFSPIRSHRCRPTVIENGRPLQLTQVSHQVWINLLARNREAVIDAFLKRRCDDGESESVLLINQCVEPREGRAYRLEYSMECDAEVLQGPRRTEAGAP